MKLDGKKKGTMEDGVTLWLAEVNKMANKVLSSNDETETLASHHRRILKFVRKEITSKR
jgi:sulfur relay (sulfurtransferase) DsrC/TusE family protein